MLAPISAMKEEEEAVWFLDLNSLIFLPRGLAFILNIRCFLWEPVSNPRERLFSSAFPSSPLDDPGIKIVCPIYRFSKYEHRAEKKKQKVNRSRQNKQTLVKAMKKKKKPYSLTLRTTYPDRAFHNFRALKIRPSKFFNSTKFRFWGSKIVKFSVG